MKISVIVPVYNVQDYLKKCAASIISQTFKDMEIILVDDGSTDSSGQMCDELSEKDSRIKVIHKKNGGLSDARNAGIDAASGEFLFFVDSDDWIDTDTLELLYETAMEEKADIVECSYRNIYSDHIEEETANTNELIIGDSVFALRGQVFWRYFKSVAWNKLYSRKIFSDGKRYPVGCYHEDEYFTHKAFCAAEKLVYIDISKYNYVRERSGSITDKVTSKILDGCYALQERIHYVQELQLDEVLVDIQNAYCWILFDRMYQCYEAGVNDTKMQQFMKELKEQENTILKWSISKEHKKRYQVLCDSYELFAKTYNSQEEFDKIILSS